MPRYHKGDIVWIPFPFTDLTNSKHRPAVVLVDLNSEDYILCQITTQQSKDDYAISLNPSDVVNGTLKFPSYIRPNKIFTASKKIIIKQICTVNTDKLTEIINCIVYLMQS